MNSVLCPAAFPAVVLVFLSFPAEASEGVSPCVGPLSRENLIGCVLAESPALRAEAASVRAALGRRAAARPVLPSNPVLGGTLASRSAAAASTLNWSLSLAQELEVAGQPGLRLAVAEAELRAQDARLAAARAALAEEVWSTYFRVLGAEAREALAAKLSAATAGVGATVRAMAAEGLASELDGDVAEAAATRTATDLVEARAQRAAARAQLAALAGSETDVTGPLEPLQRAEVAAASPLPRPELQVLEALEGAVRGRVDALRRARVPNPTVSLFAQNDGFSERVLGVGLSLPIPLPQPIGRFLEGEVLEAEAVTAKVEAELERARRELAAEAAVARAQYDAGRQRRALHDAGQMDRARMRLEAIGAQVKLARLPVRDALVGQQALIELLKADLDAREAWCLASVRLIRATGHSLEGEAP